MKPEQDKKFQDLSKKLSENGYGKHIVIILDDKMTTVYTDDLYIAKHQLKDIFLNLASMSGQDVEGHATP